MDAKTTNLVQAASWVVEEWRQDDTTPEMEEAITALSSALDDLDVEDEPTLTASEDDDGDPSWAVR